MMTTPSAKPLFRAMRSKRKPAEQAGMFADLADARRPEEGRREHDFYPTGQPEAIRALLARDGGIIRSCGSVWEPACGDGALVREIRAFGLPCVATDLIDRGCPDNSIADFFGCEVSRGGAIITNPPFNLINARDGHGRWLRHTLDMPGWRYLALLLSWDWPAARANGLGALLDQHPFSYCYLMRWKLDFTGEGSPPQRNAWFVWNRAYRGAEPGFRFLNREDADHINQGRLL